MDNFDRVQMARRFAEILVNNESQYTKVDMGEGSFHVRTSFERMGECEVLAKRCFDLADAMLAEENKRKSEQCQK